MNPIQFGAVSRQLVQNLAPKEFVDMLSCVHKKFSARTYVHGTIFRSVYLIHNNRKITSLTLNMSFDKGTNIVVCVATE